MQNSFLIALRIFFALLVYAILFFILLVILSYVKPQIKDLGSYRVLNTALSVQGAVTAKVEGVVNKAVPTVIKGFDYTRPLIMFFLLMLVFEINGIREKLRSRETYSKFEGEFEKILKVTHLDEHNKDVAELKHDLEELKHVHGKKRKDLILHFMEVKSRLESYEHVLSFLSIDVVGSTAMKKTENAMVISADFYRYNEMADRVMKANNVIKMAKTPDGIMAAFSDTDHAVSAAQQLINELDHFNKFVKKMKSEFQIRCGINTGMIYFDIDEPLEHLSDRVIDIAGHMQKEAEPNTINIAKSAIAPLDKTGGFTTTEKVIDEQVVYTWRPK